MCFHCCMAEKSHNKSAVAVFFYQQAKGVDSFKQGGKKLFFPPKKQLKSFAINFRKYPSNLASVRFMNLFLLRPLCINIRFVG